MLARKAIAGGDEPLEAKVFRPPKNAADPVRETESENGGRVGVVGARARQDVAFHGPIFRNAFDDEGATGQSFARHAGGRYARGDRGFAFGAQATARNLPLQRGRQSSPAFLCRISGTAAERNLDSHSGHGLGNAEAHQPRPDHADAARFTFNGGK